MAIKRKICVVTGNRSDYGLMSPLMSLLKEHSFFELQIIATGAHLSAEFGYTIKEIEEDGFHVNKRIEIVLSSDSKSAVVKSMGLLQLSIGDAFDELRPDLILVLGDRYEMLSAVSAALIFNIPVAHISGGEITEGAIDDSIRHAITKMSHIHFTAMDEYRNRVIQLGENPSAVFTIGEIGLDKINLVNLRSKEELEKDLDLKFKTKNILLAYHPVTTEKDSGVKFAEILSAIDSLEDTFTIISYPNADAGGREIISMIDNYVATRKDTCKAFKSLGHLRFLSTINVVDVVIGNSSSGIVEVPSFRKASINIGDRQKGRIQASSTLNCKENKEEIIEALNIAFSENFQSSLEFVVNPYGDGFSSVRALEILKNIDLNSITKKKFYDLA
ncbi:MAG: UDP-N-acetylglucosamine 2-epimerase (hydrolyzing) [Chitinophagales bacterium]|nr:UDP-N-acetylglucosamine 2-epimerase (hydrolyzing) [Chitinophagales bacterium]